MDAQDERRRVAGGVRRRRMRRQIRAQTRRDDRGRRDVGTCLRRRRHQGRPLRPGRRVPDGRRRRPHPGRRLRQFLQGLWNGRGEPAGSRNRHRRRNRPDGQRLHESRPVLGAEGRGRRLSWRRHAPDPADARSAAILRPDVHHHQGDLRGGVPPADRPDRRFLWRGPVQSALGRADRLPAGQCPLRRHGSRA